MNTTVPKVNFLQRLVRSRAFNRIVLTAIVSSALLVGVETIPTFDPAAPWGKVVLLLQDAILWLFLLEVIVKVGAHGARPWRFFLDPWNVFDFAIVAICFLPLQTNFVAIYRLARLLRTLRLVTALPQLQLMVGALLRSIPSLGYVGVLLMLHFYIYAVVGTFLFRANDPVQFGTLSRTTLTLFEVLTLEAWPEYLRTQMYGSDAYYDDAQRQLAGEVPRSQAWPIVAPLYFGSFIFLGAMIVLNLFTGIIIKGLEDAQDEVAEAERKQDAEMLGRDLTVADELCLLSEELQEVAQRLEMLQANVRKSPAAGVPLSTS